MDLFNTIFIISLIFHFALNYLYKRLRKRKKYVIMLLITALIAIIGFFLSEEPSFTYVEINLTVFFYLPFLSILFIGFSRLSFQVIFEEEPILARPLALSWKQGEIRRLHFGDILYSFMTIIGPILIIMIINNYFYT